MSSTAATLATIHTLLFTAITPTSVVAMKPSIQTCSDIALALEIKLQPDHAMKEGRACGLYFSLVRRQVSKPLASIVLSK